MKNNHSFSFMHTFQWAATMGLIASLATACGRSPDGAMQEDTDLAQATNLFDAAPAQGVERAQNMTSVLARVDGTEITQGDLVTEFNILATRLQGRVAPERMAQMRDEMLQGAMDNLVIKQLLLNQVEKEQVEIDEQDIDETIEQYRQQLPPGTTLDEQLAQINMSEAVFRENIARDIRVNKLLESKVGEPIEPTDEQIAAFYAEHQEEYFEMPERVKSSHILVSVEPDADADAHEAALEKAEDLRQQLVEGADFAELAEAESDCPSAVQGGDLGTFVRGQMVPPFEEAAFSQPIGEIGDVVQTEFGYHIIQVAERHEAGTTSLEDSKDQIAQFLATQSREQALRDYVTSLRDQAEIEMISGP